MTRRRFLRQSAVAAAALSSSAISSATPFDLLGRSTSSSEARPDGPAPGALDAPSPARTLPRPQPLPQVKIALAGDTMLGRGVGELLRTRRPDSLFAPEVVAAAAEADLFVLNLECCISERGEPWPAPGKPFFFRAPPTAVDVLAHLGVDCVTLANNHALDFGYEALLDTFDHLAGAGIRWVGAGPDLAAAREPALLEARGFRLKIVAVTDHPRDFAARADQPGVAFADLRLDVPAWVSELLDLEDAGAVLLSPHWGPNMQPEPLPYICRAAAELRSKATLIAGHSAHVFQGVDAGSGRMGTVLYDLGDFIDDYADDPVLRNDLGLLFLVTLDDRGPVRLEAVPLALDYGHTRLAEGEETAWIRRRFRKACAALSTSVLEEGGRLVIDLRPQAREATAHTLRPRRPCR